jgi:hypothetical protein
MKFFSFILPWLSDSWGHDFYYRNMTSFATAKGMADVQKQK